VATSAAAEGSTTKDTTPAERAAAQTTMMRAELGLTDDQTPRIRRSTRSTRRADGPDHQELGRDVLEDARREGVEDQKEGELKGVLSDDQFLQFQAMKTEMRDKLIEKVKEQRAQKAK
jgi:hypothetical protein